MSRQIIIIDDDEDDIEIMRDCIYTLGRDYNCATFIHACEALGHLKTSLPKPDLIVMDIHMPKMDGHECLNEIRKIERLDNTLVAIYSSGMVRNEALAQFEIAGAIFF